MPVITTGTGSAALQLPFTRKHAVDHNGTWWLLVGSSSGAAELHFSKDKGQTWKKSATFLLSSGFSLDGSIFIDAQGELHAALYRNGNEIVYVRGTLDAGGETWTLRPPFSILSSNTYVYSLDLVAFPVGTDRRVAIAYRIYSGSQTLVRVHQVVVGADGNHVSVGFHNVDVIGGDWYVPISIDFYHNGDGKTPKNGTPHLYVGYSYGSPGVAWAKGTFNSSDGTYAWQASTISGGWYVPGSDLHHWARIFFDGTRLNLVGKLYNGSNSTYALRHYELDPIAGPSSSPLKITDVSGPVLNHEYSRGSVSYDKDGNIYVYAYLNSTSPWRIGEHKYTRSANNWTFRNVIPSITSRIAINAIQNGEPKKIGIFYTTGSGPYQVEYLETVSLNASPTDPSGVTVDKSTYNVGDSITINFTGSTDPEGQAVTYEAGIYDGVSQWINIATGKAGSPIIATVPPMVDTSAARVRVRAVDSGDAASGYAQSGTFSVAQEPGRILAPVNVVSSAYLVSRMAPPVRLSNGWLVGAAVQNSTIYFYVSKDNGKEWQQLCYVTNSRSGFSVNSKGTMVYLFSGNTSNDVHVVAFNAATVSNIDLHLTKLILESHPSVNNNKTAGISPDGTKLWWVISAQTTTNPNSFNIRSGSIPINPDGTLGTPGAAVQHTTHNNGTQNSANPVITFYGNNPVLIWEFAETTTPTYRIYSRKWNGTSWNGSLLVFGINYLQSAPHAIRTPNGKQHVVWHGTDATHTSTNYIRYSNATTGEDWLATPKKLVPGTNAVITSDPDGKLFITYQDGGYIKRIESTDEFATWTGPVTVAQGTMPATFYDPTFAQDFDIPPTFFQASNAVKYHGSYSTNDAPAITVNAPTGVTLTDGQNYSFDGSAVDNDQDDIVTIKYRVNNGPTNNAGSGVSNDGTPILFARALTFRNKRLWFGSTDVTGADLAEGTPYTLTIWAEDDKGGKSAEVTRTFTVIHNQAPQISGSNTNLGDLTEPPSVSYSVTDPEGDGFTIAEIVNGKTVNTFDGTAGQSYTLTISEDDWLRIPLDVPVEMKVRATDSKGSSSERVFTFTRRETHAIFQLDYEDPDIMADFTTDARASRILVTFNGTIPEGAELLVEACNNAYDENPTWEDITGSVRSGRGYIFTNQTKTAEQWGINIRFTIIKGTATERSFAKGEGGAFD